MNLDWPLMRNNITADDRRALRAFLELDTQLTNGPQVRAFEAAFAEWLGVKRAVMVNSGSSANLITLAALRQLTGPGEVIVPCITWVSDIAAVIHAGMHPVFVDVDPKTLGMDWSKVLNSHRTMAVFPTHCLGFSSLPTNSPLLARGKPHLIEDCCEALGAYHNGRKLGTYGWASNFSFYYAHHMSTIEGGMVCTDDEDLYQVLRRLRSHGMLREMDRVSGYVSPITYPEFTFMEPAYNVRSTELNAVLGLEQLKRVDENNGLRALNLKTWLEGLDAERYWVDYKVYGSSNYALPLVLRDKNEALRLLVHTKLRDLGVEFRRGTAGGGNQLRQPYARDLFGLDSHKAFPVAEHIHEYGLYIGNYPDLPQEQISSLCRILNAL